MPDCDRPRKMINLAYDPFDCRPYPIAQCWECSAYLMAPDWQGEEWITIETESAFIDLCRKCQGDQNLMRELRSREDFVCESPYRR